MPVVCFYIMLSALFRSMKSSLSNTSLGVAYRCLMTARSVNTVVMLLFSTVVVLSGCMVMSMKCLSGK